MAEVAATTTETVKMHFKTKGADRKVIRYFYGSATLTARQQARAFLAREGKHLTWYQATIILKTEAPLEMEDE